MAKAEAHAAGLQQQLTESEARISSTSAEVAALQKQLEGVQQELSKTAAVVTEKDNKVIHELTAPQTELPDREMFAAACSAAAIVCSRTACCFLLFHALCCCSHCRYKRWRRLCARVNPMPRRCRTTTQACKLMCRCVVEQLASQGSFFLQHAIPHAECCVQTPDHVIHVEIKQSAGVTAKQSQLVHMPPLHNAL